MTLPNFLIIGAAKSGTSALYRYIQQHPDIYMSPIKEPHFFSFEGSPPNTQGPDDFVNTAITDLATYTKLFDGVTTEKAIGEASPSYLYIPKAAERINYHIPNSKLIAILRHPADRAFSAYMHVVRDHKETAVNFSEALKLEDQRFSQNWGPIWHYTRASLYYEQVKRYYDIFDSEKIKILLYDDFNTDPEQTLQNIFEFLEVDTAFKPDMKHKANVSGTPKNKTVDSFVNTFFNKKNPIRYTARYLIPEKTRWRFTTNVRNRNLVRQTIPSEIRVELTQQFRDDILQLEELIDRDLSPWLKTPDSALK